jgi:hypothetical protein
VTAGKRWCPKCRQWLGAKAWYATNRNNSYCRACSAEFNRHRRTGMTAEDRAELLALQGGKCAICRTDDPGDQGWHLDHDHRHCGPNKACSRCWRGLTCSSCNLGLGKFRDEPRLLMLAYLYLLDHRVRVAQMEMKEAGDG